jgi:hypothetical protein
MGNIGKKNLNEVSEVTEFENLSQVTHCVLRIVTAKSGHNAVGFRKLKKSGFS